MEFKLIATKIENSHWSTGHSIHICDWLTKVKFHSLVKYDNRSGFNAVTYIYIFCSLRNETPKYITISY